MAPHRHISIEREAIPGALRSLAKSECLQFLEQVADEFQALLNEQKHEEE